MKKWVYETYSSLEGKINLSNTWLKAVLNQFVHFLTFLYSYSNNLFKCLHILQYLQISKIFMQDTPEVLSGDPYM